MTFVSAVEPYHRASAIVTTGRRRLVDVREVR
jgi:hypothetical protein